MGLEQFLLVGGALTVIGAISLVAWAFSKEQRIKRALRKVPPTSIAKVREGLVKVRGKVATLDVLTAPLSGRSCAYYEVIVEEKVSTGKSSTWRTIIREVEERDFLLDDGTGRARVEMVAVEAAVEKDGHWSSGTLNDATPVLEGFLQRHGFGSVGWLFNKTLRYREGVLEPGEEVAVLGWADHEIDPEPTTSGAGYRDAPTRVVVRSSVDVPLRVSDDPKTLW